MYKCIYCGYEADSTEVEIEAGYDENGNRDQDLDSWFCPNCDCEN